MSGTGGESGQHQPSVEDLEAQVEEARHELGETVDALGAKVRHQTDVKARAREHAVPLSVGLGAVVGVLVVLVVVRRRRR